MLDKTEVGGTEVRVSAPNLKTVQFHIIGKTPYMQSRFTEKARNKMKETQEAGTQARSKKKRAPRDFKSDFDAAQYLSTDGWHGIPAAAFRTGMIDVCRLIEFKMTLAKLSVFVVADGFDKKDGTPLVRIISEKGPEINEQGVRNATGVMDIRVRPMWREWEAKVMVEYDEDQFSLTDVANLLARVGAQCGIGEGRHNSRKSNGIGFGSFYIAGQEGK